MVMQAHYYFLTSLPTLPSLGEAPPLSLAEFHDRAGDEVGVSPAVGAVLLEHDLTQRASVLAGEADEAVPVVLSVAQARGEDPLPAFLLAEEDEGGTRPVGDDAMWERYYRYVAATAGRTGCGFLRDWVGFEVALRNALVVARAKVLELSADGYIVAPDLADSGADVSPIVQNWSAACDPLAAQRSLDDGRWTWLSDNGGWFSFRVDEAAAYARALVLLHRWRTIAGE